MKFTYFYFYGFSPLNGPLSSTSPITNQNFITMTSAQYDLPHTSNTWFPTKIIPKTVVGYHALLMSTFEALQTTSTALKFGSHYHQLISLVV